MNILTKTANYAWLHLWKYKANERQHRHYVSEHRGQTPVRVVFMAIDVALWRYQHLYELMASDQRFLPTIVLTPCVGREQEKDLASLRQYFDQRGVAYVDYRKEQGPYDIREKLDPDIIFYTHSIPKVNTTL